MSILSVRQPGAVFVLVCSLFIAACEGESKPFLESVEIETLGITALVVNPPANTQDTIVINPAQQMQMSLEGTSSTGESISLSPGDRSWRSSNSSILSISEDGLVTGVGLVEGTAQVSVSIGGIQSPALSITVREATLTSFNAIVGETSLERCLPEQYYAVGNFSDGSTRTLLDVDFTVADEANASLSNTDPATATLNATTAGELSLNAQAGDVGPFALQLTVLDTLLSLSIVPGTAVVDEDDTLAFAALGAYGQGDGGLSAPAAPGAPAQAPGTNSQTITQNVDWEVTAGTSNASVDNSGENKGTLLGLSSGAVVLTASCGTDRQATASIVINDVIDSASDELSFDVIGSRVVLVFPETLQLRVSRGSEYDSDEELDTGDGVLFSVSSNSSSFIDEGALETGLIRPLVQGVDIVVTAELLDDDDAVVAAGSITIEIQ